jgi:hypothetical protein
MTPVEKYLKEGRPLTDLQVESLSLAAGVLQTFLDIWKSRHKYREKRAKEPSAQVWFEDAAGKSKKGAKRHSAAVVLGRLGGSKGGKARAEKLSSKQRAAIARRAARARWARKNQAKGGS